MLKLYGIRNNSFDTIARWIYDIDENNNTWYKILGGNKDPIWITEDLKIVKNIFKNPNRSIENTSYENPFIDLSWDTNDLEIVDFFEQEKIYHTPNFKYYLKDNQLFWYSLVNKEYFDEDSYKFVLHYFKDKSKRLCIDAGACIGANTFQYSKIFNRVVVFEPDPDNCDSLKRAIKLNNINNIVVYELALIEKEDSKYNLILGENHPKFISLITKDLNQGIEIKSIPLDILPLKDVDFIKIDVQGSEHLVLEGARKTINKYKPLLQIQTNFHAGKVEEKHIFDIMNSLKYEAVDYKGQPLVFVENRSPQYYDTFFIPKI